DTLVGYDGVSFYNDAHPVRAQEGQTQDNLFAATGTGSLADLQADYDAAHVAYSRFVDEGGKLFHGDVAPDLLAMCAPEDFRNFSTLLFSTTQPINDGSNVYQGQGDLIATGELATSGDYYYHKVNGVMRPFIVLERQGIQVQDSATPDETWRASKDVKFGADARYQTGVGMWQYSIAFK
ncbi:MAG: Mu-like prophage major head subunit gpT family protein, partial [Myxococcota bacterium]